LEVFPAVLLLAAGTIQAAAQKSADWITNDQQKQIIESVRKVLPPGWGITQTAMNRTPDDWYTSDNRGFEIAGANGEHVFQLWFLPKDWIGIRQVRPNRTRLVYIWDGVLIGQDYKTITNTDQPTVQEALRRGLNLSEPSIVNGGWYSAETPFKDRLQDVDSQAQALVRHFCKGQPCRDEAAYSLIVLGVPAKTITLDCAAHARGVAQEYCVSALGYIGGRDSVRVLGEVVSDPLSTPRVQSFAAMALRSLADPSSGPALLRALATVDRQEARVETLGAIARIRYEPAASEILSLMNWEAQDKGSYAYVLASLRYRPAIPAIEQLCQTKRFSADWFLQQKNYPGPGVWFTPTGQGVEIALLRLTGSWGAPSNGVRLLLLSSEGSSGPDANRVVVVVENVGDRDLEILGPSAGDVIVDDNTYDDEYPWGTFDGHATLRVNAVAARAVDLSSWIGDHGTHRVEYQYKTATSNKLTVHPF